MQNDIRKYDILRDDLNKLYQVRTRSDIFTIEFEDSTKEQIFEEIVAGITEQQMAPDRLMNVLKKKHEEPQVLDVFAQLKEYGLLPLEYLLELNLNLSEAEKEEAQENVYEEMFEKEVVVLGDSSLGQKIHDKLVSGGYKQVSVKTWDEFAVDGESLVKKADFLVVDAYAWNPHWLEVVNKLAIEHKKPWLLVPGLKELSLQIGPLFWVGETGCYDCMKKRVNSHDEFRTYNQAYEDHLHKQMKTGKPDTFLDLDSLLDMTACLATVEVGKFLSSWNVPETWKTILLMDVFSYEISKHPLLKVPYCETCNPRVTFNLAPWLERVTLAKHTNGHTNGQTNGVIS